MSESRTQNAQRWTSLALNRFATPFTAGIFLITVVSGIALFAGVGTGYFYDMHGWVSLLLLLPFGFHVWKNRTSLLGYLKRGWLTIPLLLSLLIVAAFIVPMLQTGEGAGDPGFAAFNLLTQAPLTVVAPLVHRSSGYLVEDLRSKGFTVASIDSTLTEIATASRRDPAWVLAEIVAAQSGDPSGGSKPHEVMK